MQDFLTFCWGALFISIFWLWYTVRMSVAYERQVKRIDVKWARAAAWATRERQEAFLNGVTSARQDLHERGYAMAVEHLDRRIRETERRMALQDASSSVPSPIRVHQL
jgi:hypothetical protein